MIKSIFRLIFSTITVTAYGNAERFIELLNKNNIRYWNLKRQSDGGMSFSIYKNTYPKISNFGCRLEIGEMHGLLYILNRYRKRVGLVVGCFIFLIALYVISLFVWDIQVIGCKTISEQAVLSRLGQNGLTIGRLKSSFNCSEIENEFLKHFDEVSWISINLKGTMAYVEIREVKEQPEYIDASRPSSIYAARDGVIASVEAYMGYSVVKAGDTVTAGDLIVSGNYTDRYGVEYKLHSHAKVMAYTVHSQSVTVPIKYNEHVKTGKVKNKYSFKLTRFIIPLYFNKNIIYNSYDITKSVKKFKIGKNFVLPFEILKTTYSEVYDLECIRSKEVALAQAYEQLNDFENDLIGIVINERRYMETINDDSVTVKVMLECYEDIGIERELE